MKKKLLKILILVNTLTFAKSGVDSLQSSVNEIISSIDSLYNVSSDKIDSLKTASAPSKTIIITGSTIDCSLSSNFQITLSLNKTVTLKNFSDGQVLNIIVINKGAYKLSFNNVIEWVDKIAPALTVKGRDIITLININSIIYGSYVLRLG